MNKIKKERRYYPRHTTPSTEKERLSTLLANMEELEFMEDIDFLKLDSVPSIPYGDSISWPFLAFAIPKMNAYFRELWEEHGKPPIEKRILELRKEL